MIVSTRVVSFLLMLMLLPFGSRSQTFVSVTSGNWEDGATWGNTSPGTNGVDYPTNNDTVIIGAGTTVNQTSIERPFHLTIQSTGQLVTNSLLRVDGNYTVNGVHSGFNEIRLEGPGTEISGTGLISTSALLRINSGHTILSGSDITRSIGAIRCPNNDTLFNFGSLTMQGVDLVGVNNGVFYNATGGSLTSDAVVLAAGTFVASDSGNTVTYNRSGGGNQIIRPTLDGYYNLTIDGTSLVSQKQLTATTVVSNDLSILGSTMIATAAVQLQVGGDLTLAPGAALDVMTNPTTVTLNGTSLQLVSGALELGNLVIQNAGSGVVLAADTIRLHGKLDVLSGALATNGNLLLVSDASGDAQVGEVFGSISGDVTVQRYVAAGATGWRFLCAPVQGATLADWNDDFITSGFPGSTVPGFSFVSIMSYDETVAGHQDSGFVEPTSAGQSIATTQAYWVYCGDGQTSTLQFTIDVAGHLNTGTLAFPVTYTNHGLPQADGWNLISNPYASPIDWDAAGWSKVNIDSAVYIWNTNTGSYASYVNGIGVNGGSRAIASSQGFYVKANASSPSLSISESCKKDTVATFLRQAQPTLKLTLLSHNRSYDAAIRITPEATHDFDPAWDAHALVPEDSPLSIVTISNGLRYAINSIPEVKSDTLPLILVDLDGQEIKMTYQKNNAYNHYCTSIYDSEKREIIQYLSEVEATLSLDKTGADAGRYSLVVQNLDLGDDTCGETTGFSPTPSEDAFRAYPNQGRLVVSSFEADEAFSLFNALGQCVLSGVMNDVNIHLPSNLPAGIYYLRLERSGTTGLYLGEGY